MHCCETYCLVHDFAFKGRYLEVFIRKGGISFRILELNSDRGAKMSMCGSPTISASDMHPAREGSSKHIAFSDQQVTSKYN